MNLKSDTDILSNLFYDSEGIAPTQILPLPASGGDRKYYRFVGADRSLIGVAGDSYDDCVAFVDLSEVFGRYGVNVPEVVAVSADKLHYLQTDLGDTSLFSLLSSDAAESMVAHALRELVKMQTIPYPDWVDAVKYDPFCKRQIMWDLNYFKYEFLKPAGVSFDESALEDDFEKFAEQLLSTPENLWGFMMRDCQSRNVMVHEGAPYFIDYQGGRFGPGLYDAVSFLWQAKANFSDDFRSRMIHLYADEFASKSGADSESLLQQIPKFVLFRTLQVLGAYGFRGLVQKRAHFIESIPAALENLRGIIKKDALKEFSELEKAANELVALDRFKKSTDSTGLKVTVFSFSYKKGYPEDLSGNGGGFMFDCRGMHNPGRYAEYKTLTGLDEPVRKFLKDRGEADLFAQKAFDIVAPSVERYMQRGFDSLQIGFGCTGGQHRSVYCAEAVSEMIKHRYPGAKVVTVHREQEIVHDN